MAKQLSTRTKLCCIDCIHAKVCKHKKSAEALQKLIKDTIQFDENDGLFKIIIDCDSYYVTKLNTITTYGSGGTITLNDPFVKPFYEESPNIAQPEVIPCEMKLTTGTSVGDTQAS